MRAPSSSLGRNQARFESWLRTTDGMRFRGNIMPAPDTIGATSFLNPRLLLRVRPEEAVQPGMVVVDPVGRNLLVGSHDATIAGGWCISRAHALFEMTDYVTWQRNSTPIDVVTNLPTRGTLTSLGSIWCAIEHMGAMLSDIGTRMNVEKRRVITGSPIQLHDTIGGVLVKRVTPIYGVYVGETE